MAQPEAGKARRLGEIRAIARARAKERGALLLVLHEIQDRYGYLPQDTARIVADALNLSRAEVHGVISFYHLFRTTAPGEKTLFVCRSEACQAVGGDRLLESIKARLGIDLHQTTADGRFSLEPVYCLGNCACGPAMMVDETVLGRVDETMLETILD